MKKQAQRAKALGPVLRRMLGAGALGGAAGYYVTPYLSGYEDVPAARRLSALINAAMFAAVPGYAGKRFGGRVTPFVKHLAKTNPKALGTAPLAFAGGELPAWVSATLYKQRDAAKEQAAAAVQQAQAGKLTSIPYNITKFLESPLAKGMGGGAATAALGGILTGLMRRRSRMEQEEETPRVALMQKDFMRYLLPAVVAGGVIGSLRKPDAGVTG